MNHKVKLWAVRDRGHLYLFDGDLPKPFLKTARKTLPWSGRSYTNRWWRQSTGSPKGGRPRHPRGEFCTNGVTRAVGCRFFDKLPEGEPRIVTISLTARGL